MYAENSGNATITIIKRGGTDSNTTVTFSTVDGSAGGKHFMQLVLDSSSTVTILLYKSLQLHQTILQQHNR